MSLPGLRCHALKGVRKGEYAINLSGFYRLIFTMTGNFTVQSILSFAKSIGIAPGVVTGRLQHDGHIGHHCHMHRERYKWAT
jgi:hypothetical protein